MKKHEPYIQLTNLQMSRNEDHTWDIFACGIIVPTYQITLFKKRGVPKEKMRDFESALNKLKKLR